MIAEAAPLVPLRYCLRSHDERSGDDGLPLLAVTLSAGVVRRDNLTADEPRAEDLSSYKQCRAGDLVVNRMRAFQGALGVAPCDGLVSPDYLVLRAHPTVSSAYVAYFLRSSWGIGEMTSRIRGIGGVESGVTRTPRINLDDLKNIAIPVPALAVQRSIVEFLDRESALIEELTGEIDRATAVADEELTGFFAALLADLTPTLVPLRRMIRSIADGPFGSALASAHYTDLEEVRVVRLGNIGRGEFREASRAFVSSDYAESHLREHYLSPGDVVIAGLGDQNQPLGRACVVPEIIGIAIHKADCYRVVVDSGRCRPEYLALALSFGPATQVAPLLSRGSTRSRLNTVVARDLPVPLLDLDAQQRVSEEFGRRRRRVQQLTASYRSLVAALSEYRGALVTEAVTGEIDISKLSESLMAGSIAAVYPSEPPEVLA